MFVQQYKRMALLKDVYNLPFYKELGKLMAELVKGFSEKEWMQQVKKKNWEELEWKGRMQATTDLMAAFLPTDFPKAAVPYRKMVKKLIRAAEDKSFQSFPWLFLPDYLGRYGLNHEALSLDLMEETTQLITGEFGIRPFLAQNRADVLDRMKSWTQHPSHAVRRLSSEGCRPRLPWGMRIPELIENPSHTFPILEALKTDPSDWVRLSVANHLNDIAKDHPDWLLEKVMPWYDQHPQTDALLKHGVRTLLKKGHPTLLQKYQWDASAIRIDQFHLLTPKVEVGENLSFEFTVTNMRKKEIPLRMEYVVYFLRSKGDWGRKVFKISERTLAANESLLIHRKHSFRVITTRVYYPGKHRVALQMNGVEFDPLEFQLKATSGLGR